MAVLIQAVQLIQPHGALDCAFFPDNNLDALVGGWLTQAKAKVEANTSIQAANHDEAARQWSYYLAYDYLAGRFGSMPSSVSVNKGADSVSYGQDRPAYWAAKANAALALYNGYILQKSTTQKRFTGPIRTIATW